MCEDPTARFLYNLLTYRWLVGMPDGGTEMSEGDEDRKTREGSKGILPEKYRSMVRTED